MGQGSRHIEVHVRGVLYLAPIIWLVVGSLMGYLDAWLIILSLSERSFEFATICDARVT